MYIDSKKYNTFRVFKKILRDGPVSRLDISTSLNLTHASVLVRVNELMEKGYIKSSGYEKRTPDVTKGRYTNLIGLGEPYIFPMTFYLNNKEITGVLSTVTLDKIDQKSRKIRKPTVETTARAVKEIFDELLKVNCLKKENIIGTTMIVRREDFDDLAIVKEGGTLSADTITQRIEKKTGITCETISFTDAAGIYYFNKDFSKRITPSEYSIINIDAQEQLNASLIEYRDGVKFLKISERDLNQCMVVSDLTRESSSNINTIIEEFQAKHIIENIIDDPQCTDREEWSRAGFVYPPEKQEEMLAEALLNKDYVPTKYMQAAATQFVIFLHNIYTVYTPKRIYISRCFVSDKFIQLMIKTAKDLFGEEFVDIIIFDGNEEVVYLGGLQHAIDSGFVYYYYDIPVTKKYKARNML